MTVKILFTTINRRNLVGVDAIHHFEQAIAKVAECKWAGKGHLLFRRGENMSQTVKRVLPNADWVISDSRSVSPTKRRNYKAAIWISDIHANWRWGVDTQGYIKHLNDENWDAILMCYTQIARSRGDFPNFHPKIYLQLLKAPIFNSAVSINPDIFKPINKPKIYDVAFLGATNPGYYPLRNQIFEELPKLAKKKGWNAIVRQKPPGAIFIDGKPNLKIDLLLKKGYIVGSRYAKTLALSKAFIFGTSIYKYPLIKFPEAMACKTCVFADAPLTAKELHYVPNWNFVEINKGNWKQKLSYYIKHDGEREEIARRGYETVLKHHTNDIRARQLIKFLETH